MNAAAADVALTTAYIMKGIASHLSTRGETIEDLINCRMIKNHKWCERDFMEVFTHAADLCEQTYGALTEGRRCSTVWEYDVSEPLGEWLAVNLLEDGGRREVTDDQIRAEVTRLAMAGPFKVARIDKPQARPTAAHMGGG